MQGPIHDARGMISHLSLEFPVINAGILQLKRRAKRMISY